MIPHHTHIQNVPNSIISDFPSPNLDAVKPLPVELLSQIFTGDSVETIHTGLYHDLIDNGTDGVLEKLKEYAADRRRIVEQLYGRIKVHEAHRDADVASRRIVGADAGRNGTNYRFAFVPIYGAVAILVDNWKITEEPLCAAGAPDVWPTEKDADRRESLLHMALEYHVAKKAVEKWSPAYLFFDGGLVLNPRLHIKFGGSDEYRRDFIFTVITALSLLETCKRHGVGIVGFVKRTQMNHFYNVCNITPIRDTILLNSLMKTGEYIDTFLMKNMVTKTYQQFAHKFELDESTVEIHSSYIKTSQTPPYRIEIPLFCLDKIEEITSILLTMADPEGIPYPVHEADRYTKITKPTSNIHALLLYTKALELVKKGQLDPADLDLFILQYGEQWSLHESESWGELGREGGRR
jgi:hypothetical protein